MLNEQQRRRVKERARKELREFSLIFIYVWVLLGLLAIHKSVILTAEDISYKQGFAFLNALVLAKVVFIAEKLRVGENLKDEPLVYPILFKSAVFSLILICFHTLEEVLIGKLHGKTVAQSISDIGGGTLVGILLVGIMMFVVLIPFIAFQEIGRVIGEGELQALLFTRRRTGGTP